MRPVFNGIPIAATLWATTLIFGCLCNYRGGLLILGVVLYTNCSFVTRIPGRYTEVAFIRVAKGSPLYKVIVFNCINTRSTCINYYNYLHVAARSSSYYLLVP